MSRRAGLALLFAIIIGVFAYSAFINVQRDENPSSLRSVGD